MGLADTIKSAVSGAMQTLDDLAPAVTYTSVNLTSGSYNPATGTYAPASDTAYTGVSAVLARFSIDEMDESIVPQTDMKALIAALDLGATPKVQDKITTAAGATYAVVRILGVPGESLHILHIRLTE